MALKRATTLSLAALCCAATTVAPAQTHPCAADAIAKAAPLLRLHFGAKPGEPVENVDVENKAKVLPSIKALKGSGRFDVLEIWGYIYKASYRMRFIYARSQGSCVLMGQEILEASDPY